MDGVNVLIEQSKQKQNRIILYGSRTKLKLGMTSIQNCQIQTHIKWIQSINIYDLWYLWFTAWSFRFKMYNH